MTTVKMEKTNKTLWSELWKGIVLYVNLKRSREAKKADKK